MGSNFNISRDCIFYPIHKLNYHMEKIKLIWDFRGPACSRTAAHFKIHLIEFFEFIKVRKKYWLLPIIIILVFFGGLIVLSQGSAVAPFIYTLF